MIFEYTDGLVTVEIDIGEVEQPPEQVVEA